ncbi:MAG: ferrous iron transporter B, partial [Clostridia bacterium]|nr:ferrous iron transporter B [Clostridia bacterium]
LPANEIVLPIILMIYLQTGSLNELPDIEVLKTILIENGWTFTTAICTIVFSLFHFPCSTTLLTIHKETKSIKWTLASFIIPLLTGVIVCLFIKIII